MSGSSIAPWGGTRRRHARIPVWAWNLPLVLLIAALDWVTPKGIVVGLLLAIPVLLSSLSQRPIEVWLTLCAALAAFLIAGLFGRAPVASEMVWVPNRLLALMGIGGSGLVALSLQRRALAAQAAADEATRLSEMNQLLNSLIAHDLRAPLGLAVEALDLTRRGSAQTSLLDPGLLDDVLGRLRRSVTTLDQVVAVTRRRLDPDRTDDEMRDWREAAPIIVAEVEGFLAEAEARGKRIRVESGALEGRDVRVDPLLLRHGIAIVLENALRYADPGLVTVSADATRAWLTVSVADSGPGLSSRPAREGTEGGLGIGLRLCRQLVRAGGGSLEVVRDSPDGTTVAFALPVATR